MERLLQGLNTQNPDRGIETCCRGPGGGRIGSLNTQNPDRGIETIKDAVEAVQAVGA